MVLNIEERRRRRDQRKRLLEEKCQLIVEQLESMGALKIVLFGSYASGAVGLWSDLDLIVIMPDTKSGREWMKKIYEEVERGVAADVLAYTEKELEETLPVSSFLRHALKTGRVIYEKRP